MTGTQAIIRQQILQHQNTSVIILFQQGFENFRVMIETNYPFFCKNGVEVIVLLDFPLPESRLLSFLKIFPLVNWQIYSCNNTNSAEALNFAVDTASFEYLFFVPETFIFTNETIPGCQWLALHYKDYFLTGSPIDSRNKCSVLFSKKEFIRVVQGFNNLHEMILRLGFSGKKMLVVQSLDVNGSTASPMSNGLMKQALNPSMLYDYRKHPFKKELMMQYLERSFKQYYINNDLLSAQHKLICLMPVRNETMHIPEVLYHLEQHCDAIILLDDDSVDDTYEKASCNKLLAKVKIHRTEFNERRIKNILLDIASFCNAEWFFFHDADERFDGRFNDLRLVAAGTTYDTVMFYLAHLWDEPSTFRINLDEQSAGIPGLVLRWRMFRNIGRMQFEEPDKIHIRNSPYRTRPAIAPVLIQHFGMLSRDIRMAKADLYKQEDNLLQLNPGKYDYFADPPEKIRYGLLSNIRHLPAIVL